MDEIEKIATKLGENAVGDYQHLAAFCGLGETNNSGYNDLGMILLLAMVAAVVASTGVILSRWSFAEEWKWRTYRLSLLTGLVGGVAALSYFYYLVNIAANYSTLLETGLIPGVECWQEILAERQISKLEAMGGKMAVFAAGGGIPAFLVQAVLALSSWVWGGFGHRPRGSESA